MKPHIHLLVLAGILLMAGCGPKEPGITNLSMLEGGKTFAVPTGTVADQFVTRRFPDARIEYYNSVLDCALAVKGGKADAGVYDEPILKNIAAKNEGLMVLAELLEGDKYGFAVRMDSTALKTAIDQTLSEIKANGIYEDMMKRWFPVRGAPAAMPAMENEGSGTLIFGTAAVTEPMAFVDANRKVVGFDVEFAHHIARKLGRKLEIVDMEFGAMLPALIAGKVDLIGAGLSITEERAKKVLFSESYYPSGIAAVVRGDPSAGTMSALDDLADKKIGIFTGTVFDAFIAKKFPQAQISRYESTADLMLSVQTGKIDAAMFDLITARLILKHNPDLKMLSDNVLSMPMGVGFRKDNPALRKEFNDFLKESQADGSYDIIKNRWFVEDAEEAVMPVFPAAPNGKKLVAGVSVDDLPYVAVMKGEFVGFDIEMIKTFAQRKNYNLEIITMEFPSLVAALAAGKVDLVTDGIGITEERGKQIDFSDPVAEFRTGVVVAAKNMAGFNTGDTKVAKKSFLTKIKDSFYSNIILEKRYLLILSGLKLTILISIFAALVGTMLGGLVCWMRMSKRRFLTVIAGIYINLLRGTPVLVLLMIIYYIVFASVNINPAIVAVIAFGLNFGAYVSEMFRTSIESIDKGQKEAGIAGGFTKIQTFIHIITPQALRYLLPVYKGEFISLVKMTSIVGYIAVQDLTKASDIIRSRTFDAFFPLLMAAVLYLMLAWLLTWALGYIEISVDPKRKQTKKVLEATR